MKGSKGGRNRFAALCISAAILLGAVSPAFAVSDSSAQVYQVTRISNAQNLEGEPDGLYGSNRNNSCAWTLAERDGKLYIGTGAGLGETVVHLLQQKVEASGNQLSEEALWKILDVLLQNTLPHPDADATGSILIYNRLTGEFSELIAAKALLEPGCTVRSAVSFEDDIYFTTEAEDANHSTQILCLDRQDRLTEVFSGSQGSCMRASCILEDALYFAGSDESLRQSTSDNDSTMLTVLRRDESAEQGWSRVADDRDFGPYTTDPYLSAAFFAPIWDLCAFDGSLWATLPGTNGFVIFEGHPAGAGETANKYGWVWTEIVGSQNGKNAPGLSEQPDGYHTDDGSEPFLSVCCSLYVFQEELYAYDTDAVLLAELSAVDGLRALEEGGKAADVIDPIYRILRHPQRISRWNPASGRFEEVSGLTELLDGTCIDALCCAQAYRGELYLGTMDSAGLYGYLTQLTSGSFLKWSSAEWLQELGAIRDLLIQLRPLMEETVQNNHYIRFLDEILEKIDLLMSLIDQDAELDPEIAAYILENWEMILNNIEDLLLELWDEILADETAAEIAAAVTQEDWDNPALDSALAKWICSISGSGAEKSGMERGLWLKSVYGTTPSADDGQDQSLAQALLVQLLKDLSEQLYDSLALVQRLTNAFDRESLEKYIDLCATVEQNTPGFDIYKTADGEHWEPVTTDGFGDRYNYAAVSFSVTEEGLYIGTLNPCYGAQLWLLSCIAVGDCSRDETCPINSFDDANPNSWYHDGVHWCLSNHIMNGVSTTEFAPNDPTTRAQVVTMLWRMAGRPTPSSVNTVFTDVVAGSYYETAVCWAAETGIVKGVSATRFAPDENITREQFATILYRLAEKASPAPGRMESFTDGNTVSGWAADAMSWGIDVGILNGIGNGLLSPKSEASRAQAATMLMRFNLVQDTKNGEMK